MHRNVPPHLARRCLLLGLSLFLADTCSFARAAAAEQSSSPPNVLVIISDDQAWGDYGFMGHPHLRTPHLDRLAAQSLLFQRGYSPVPLCRPALSSIVTGLYPHQHGVTGNDPSLPDQNVNAMAARGNPKYARYYDTIIHNFRQRPNFVRDLVSRGYLAFQTGKWWEGDPKRTAGFTHAMTHAQPPQGRHGDAGLDIGRKGLEPIFRFLEQAGEKPWLIWYAPFLPHAPHTPPDDLFRNYLPVAPTEPVARYWANVEWFDRTCGELIQHLEQRGQRQNTIILYTTDNGWIQDPHRPNQFAPRSKRTPYEGGVRTPILISWPEQIPPRVDRQHLASNVDLWPTLAALLEIPPPPGLPGINLTDPRAVARRSRIFGEQYAHDIADVNTPTRSLEHRWIIDGWWKLILPDPQTRPGRPPELYDLRKDPSEQNNLASQHHRRVTRLHQQLDAWWNPTSNRPDTSADRPLRSLRVPLPPQTANAIPTSWPRSPSSRPMSSRRTWSNSSAASCGSTPMSHSRAPAKTSGDSPAASDRDSTTSITRSRWLRPTRDDAPDGILRATSCSW